MQRVAFPAHRLAEVVLIPLIFNLLGWLAEPMLARFWAALFEFWLPRLNLSGSVSIVTIPPLWLGMDVPVVDLPSRIPAPWAWWGSALAAAGLVWISFVTPDRLLPLRYFLRFLVLVHISALVYFGVAPASFPHTLPGYLRSSFVAGLWLMALLPWVHSLIYHIFDFSLVHKLALTLLSLLFLAVAIPLQLLSHAHILTFGSLLFLPVLYLLFGILPLSLGCIALYGWAMSWRRM